MPPDICPVCKKKDPDVQCEICELWYHQKCVLPAGLKHQQIEKIHWHCDDCCKAGLITVKNFNQEKIEFNNVLKENKEMKVTVEEMKGMMEILFSWEAPHTGRRFGRIRTGHV